MPPKSLTVSVDRIEGKIVVLEGDNGRRYEVPARVLSDKPSEGLIYTVPLDASGSPLWNEAVADSAETDRRRRELRDRMDSRRKRDNGGDIEL